MARTKDTVNKPKGSGKAPTKSKPLTNRDTTTKGGGTGRKVDRQPDGRPGKTHGNATAPAAAAAGQRPHRYRPGTLALREIRMYQQAVGLLIPRASFRRLVLEIVQTKYTAPDANMMMWTQAALAAIQYAVEAKLVEWFEDLNLAAIHRKRITISPKESEFVNRIYERHNIGNPFAQLGTAMIPIPRSETLALDRKYVQEHGKDLTVPKYNPKQPRKNMKFFRPASSSISPMKFTTQAAAMHYGRELNRWYKLYPTYREQQANLKSRPRYASYFALSKALWNKDHPSLRSGLISRMTGPKSWPTTELHSRCKWVPSWENFLPVQRLAFYRNQRLTVWKTYVGHANRKDPNVIDSTFVVNPIFEAVNPHCKYILLAGAEMPTSLVNAHTWIDGHPEAVAANLRHRTQAGLPPMVLRDRDDSADEDEPEDEPDPSEREEKHEKDEKVPDDGQGPQEGEGAEANGEAQGAEANGEAQGAEANVEAQGASSDQAAE